MTPVVERWSFDCPFWVVEQDEFYVPVPRMPTPGQSGAVLWALIGPAATGDDGAVTATEPAAAVEAYLALDDAFVAGGLRMTKGECVIDPGCCADLGEWRDWQRVVAGYEIDLGHSPTPFVEHRGPTVRVWSDGGHAPAEGPFDPATPYIDIARADLPVLLHAVQQDLMGFHAAIRPWVEDLVGPLAQPLLAAVDQRLLISAPLR
ncbi:hypothetical protein ACFQX7_20585 [Luedemannella flava]|uniref:hypothetical protein n=1 Tax=Luedemannella flava TaxID=349316 RepID=UPI0031E21602